VAICAELCSRTNGGDDSTYAVVLHEHHFRELFLKATTPPPTLKPAGSAAGAGARPTAPTGQIQNGAAAAIAGEENQASLLMMGFPSRALAPKGTLTVCACHNKPSREGYACTRCRAKVCRLPSECPACGLTLILSTHLARSYHHLFPLRLWVEVSWAEAAEASSVACYSCLTPFPALPGRSATAAAAAAARKAAQKARNSGGAGGGGGGQGGKERGSDQAAPPPKGVSESGRYKCTVCGNHFCIDCDVFAHEVLHNCPGCQSDTRGQATGRSEDMEVTMEAQTVAAADASGNGLNANGHSRLPEDMGSGEPDGFLAPQLG
jgi:transcription initiation factor TFIIH subunit 2